MTANFPGLVKALQ